MMAVILAATAAGADTVPVPSGQSVTFLELVRDVEGTAGNTWRYRFVAPAIARDSGLVPIDTALADIDALCTTFVLPDLAGATERPDQVVISLADRIVEFGTPAPDATQYFEAYSVESGACIWEGF
jgi:hypothetical protein